MKNPRITAKERGLIKGSLRRVFSRSELRKEALQRHAIAHSDPSRPRVTKWSWCGECGVIEAQYLMEVDHVNPIVEINETSQELDANTIVDRLWCDADNLVPKCKPCHRRKTLLENKERRAYKKGKTK